MDSKLTTALNLMEARGLKVDIAGLRAFSNAQVARRDEIGIALLNLGITKPGSRKEVSERLGISMNQDKATLVKLNRPEVMEVIKWRAMQREVSYGNSLLEAVQTGRVYWHWLEAASGRLYTAEYSVQQISKGAREYVLPDHGMFICVDYRQAEVRAAAILSGDEQLKKDIASGDVYSLLADTYFKGIKDSRDKVKVMVLGIFYGMNETGISMRLDIPTEAAAGIQKSMMARYKGLAAWIEKTHTHADLDKQVTTLDGFTRKLTEPDFEKRRRQAVNTSVQGSMADILKRAVRASTELTEKFGGELACLVHDSLVIDCPEATVEWVAEGWKAGLEFEIQGVKMELKVKQGKTWGTVTDDKPEVTEARL